MPLSGRLLPSFVVYLLLRAAVSAQTITEFPLPEGTQPRSIVARPDGNLWFIEHFDGTAPMIGQITTTGSIVHFPIEGLNLSDSGSSGGSSFSMAVIVSAAVPLRGKELLCL